MYWNGQRVENGGIPTPHGGVEVNASHLAASHFASYLTVYYMSLCLNVTDTVASARNNCADVMKRFHNHLQISYRTSHLKSLLPEWL
jgi:hypothetical protein